jgi:hypothetical protein
MVTGANSNLWEQVYITKTLYTKYTYMSTIVQIIDQYNNNEGKAK